VGVLRYILNTVSGGFMRLHLLALGVLSGLTLSLFSCSPKDDKLPPRPNSVTQQGNDSGVEMNPAELRNLMALTFDRTSESLALIKATLNPEYAKELNITSPDQNNLDDSTSTSMVTGLDSSATLVMKASGLTFINSVNYEVESLKKNAKGEVIKMTLIDASMAPSLGIKNIKGRDTDFKSIALSGKITIKRSQIDGLYNLTVERIEDTSSAKDKSSVIHTKITALVQWNGSVESLNREVVISAFEFNVKRSGQKKGTLKLSHTDSNLTVKLNKCVELDADLMMANVGSQKDKNIQVILRSSTLSIEQLQFESKAQSCESRPLVDLTRML
jgi:hypothetical protein